jgi:imidazolonepropionase-like amidohydrolase
VVNGSGDTLLPGFFDSHAHSYSRAALQQELLFGVTTELDMDDDPSFAIPIQKAQMAGQEHDTADIFTSGWAATCPGGHGTEGATFKIPTLSSTDEAQAFVDARVAEGSNYIKIIYDKRSWIGNPMPTLDDETLKSLVRAAHKRGKIAVVHIGTYTAALDAANAGADAIAHLFVDRMPGPDFGRILAARHMFVIGTLTVLQAEITAAGATLAADPDLAPFLTEHPAARLKESIVNYLKPSHPALKLEYAYEAVRQLIAAGVPVLAGTDAPNPGTFYGVSIHREIELLTQAGLTEVQALAAATSVPAEIFKIKDRGRIAPGLRAGFLLVKGGPTQNILDSRKIVAIWKSGAAVDRVALKGTWEKAFEEYNRKDINK